MLRRIAGRAMSSLPRERIPVVLREEDLVEQHVLGGGKGGQKINKTANCVFLKHLPTSLTVRCQKTRSLLVNRKIARKLMEEKLDHMYNGADSLIERRRQQERRRKARRRRRQKDKYHKADEADEAESDSEA